MTETRTEPFLSSLNRAGRRLLTWLRLTSQAGDRVRDDGRWLQNRLQHDTCGKSIMLDRLCTDIFSKLPNIHAATAALLRGWPATQTLL